MIDEIVKRSHSYRDMATALDAALAEIDRLRLEVAGLRSENRELRRKLRDHELRMLRRAQRDALLIGALHVAGLYTSKRECRKVGITENRWSLARVLLRLGGAFSKRTRRMKAETGEDFERAIQHAVRIIESEGGEVLRNSSYRHRRRHRGAPNGAPVGADSVTNPLHYTREA